MKSYLHSISSLVISIVLAATVIIQVEGFIATTSQTQTIISHQQILCISPRIVSTLQATNDNADEKEDELPKAGSFFNEVPPPKEENNNDDTSIENEITSSTSQPVTFSGDDTDMFEQIIQQTKLNTGGGFSKTTSTTNHVPSSPSIIQSPSDSKSFIGIGKPLNDIQNPETDSDGYTIYTDETTGEKSRVFEALIDYPNIFKMKIVGRDPDEPDKFTPDIVNTVANSCGVDISMVKYTEKTKGKWISVTVHAPVRDADMLYSLYENVDKDPRVKFKF